MTKHKKQGELRTIYSTSHFSKVSARIGTYTTQDGLEAVSITLGNPGCKLCEGNRTYGFFVEDFVSAVNDVLGEGK